MGVSAYSSLSGRGWGKGFLLFETAAFRMSPHSRGTEGANSRLGARANKYGTSEKWINTCKKYPRKSL